MAAHVFAARAEQRDEHRKLPARDERRRKNDDARDDRPSEDLPAKAHAAKRAEHERELRDAIAERVRQRDEERFERARQREGVHGRAAVAAQKRVRTSTKPDAEQRDDEDEAEGEGGAAEDGTEHPVPDQFHEHECEAHDDCGEHHETGGCD